MPRLIWLNPLLVPLVAGCGWLVCKAVGAGQQVKWMLLAAAACAISSLAGSAPLILARQARQPGMIQAALIATLVHMMLGVGLAAATILALRPPTSFVLWLVLFYWVTLAGLVIVCVKAVRSAPLAGGAK
ncbi:MAG: hypothetical protein ABSH20_14730 [Tepidisphaeraceae bacterium]|jgi:hypothetical protein